MMAVILKRKGRHTRAFSTTLNAVYILSAVRTPPGALAKCTVPQMCAAMVKEGLQRAIVPPQDMRYIFMACPVVKKMQEELYRQTITSRLKPGFDCGMTCFTEANQLLLRNEESVCMAVGMVLNHMVDAKRQEKLMKAYKSGAFQDEIAKPRGFQDDFEGPPQQGAVAVVLATGKYIKENDLTPLAKVISFAESEGSPPVDAIKKALSQAQSYSEGISQWEIDGFFGEAASCYTDHLSIDPTMVNRDGGCPTGLGGVCHLVHSLSVGQLGCAAAGTSATVVLKIGEKSAGRPRLTLFTKHPCPLCEELKEELQPFRERFDLEEVDIEAEENRKLRTLFRYDIPVLFLDGRFLCKHRLDVEHFGTRLLQSEKRPRHKEGSL